MSPSISSSISMSPSKSPSRERLKEFMEDRTVSMGWVSVPAFGEWEHKKDWRRYSLDFSQAREARRQNKASFTLFNEEYDDHFHRDLQQYHLCPRNDHDDDRHHANHYLQRFRRRCRLSHTIMKKIMSYFDHPKIPSFFHHPKIPSSFHHPKIPSCFPRGS